MLPRNRSHAQPRLVGLPAALVLHFDKSLLAAQNVRPEQLPALIQISRSIDGGWDGAAKVEQPRCKM